MFARGSVLRFCTPLSRFHPNCCARHAGLHLVRASSLTLDNYAIAAVILHQVPQGWKPFAAFFRGAVALCACVQMSPGPARLHKLLVFEIMENAHKEVSVAGAPRRPMLGVFYDKFSRCAVSVFVAWALCACAWARQTWARRTANMNGFSVDRGAGRLEFASLTKARCAHDALFCITRTGPRPEASGSLFMCSLACGHVCRDS
jgi:hypothetical protein